jgi:nickel-dependent lactate racemase
VPIVLPYNDGSIEGETSLRLRVLEPRWPVALSAESLKTKFPSHDLRLFLAGRKRVTVLLPDQTRRCDARVLLGLLAPLLRDREVRLLTANGLHPPMGEKILHDLYGEESLRRWPLIQHDPDDEKGLVDVGVSPQGNRIRLNRVAVEADAILALSSISFHYFAGFGGGRKLLMPGVAARECITTNHKMVISHGVPGAGILRGNILHAEMRWVERLFRDRLFHLVAGLDEEFRIAALWGGEGPGPLLRSARWLRRMQAVPLDRRYPYGVISCGGAPKDINLIQAHKSLEFAHRAVEPGGVILFAAACPQGAGSKQFFPWFRFAGKGGGEGRWRKELLKEYQVSGQTALRWHMKSKSHEIWMITDLNGDDFAPLGARRISTLQEGLDLLERRYQGREGTLIPHAGSVLPVVYK